MTGVGIWEFALGAPLVGAGFSFGFVVVRWFANFVAGRMDKRQDHIDEATRELIDGLRFDVSDLRERVTSAEGQLRDCHRKHAESEAKVMHLEAVLAGFGDANQSAQRIIAQDALDKKEAKN